MLTITLPDLTPSFENIHRSQTSTAHEVSAIGEAFSKTREGQSLHAIAAGYDLGLDFLWKLLKYDPTPCTTSLGRIFDRMLGRKPLEENTEEEAPREKRGLIGNAIGEAFRHSKNFHDAQGKFCQAYEYFSAEDSLSTSEKVKDKTLCTVRFSIPERASKQDMAHLMMTSCRCFDQLCLNDEQFYQAMTQKNATPTNMTTFTQNFAYEEIPVEIRYTNLVHTFSKEAVEFIADHYKKLGLSQCRNQDNSMAILYFSFLGGLLVLSSAGLVGVYCAKRSADKQTEMVNVL